MDVMIHSGEDVVRGMAEIIARLPWEPYRNELIELLANPANLLADAAARILIERPASLDAAMFIADSGKKANRTRRLYCAILSRLPQTEASRKFFLESLHDRDDGMRWQAALAIATAKCSDEQSVSGLVQGLNDPNEYVAAAAAHSLGGLGVNDTGGVLLQRLRARLQEGNASREELARQGNAVTQDIGPDYSRHSRAELLDPAHLELRIRLRVPEGARQKTSLRVPPQAVAFPTHDYTLVDALIEALGDVGYEPAADELFRLYATEYEATAMRALKKVVPERLGDHLVAKATDKQLDSYLRERAMATLCDLTITNRLRDLVPLLDDVTPIIYERRLPATEWRICDRAAASIAILLGWEHSMGIQPFAPPEARNERLKRAREWAGATR